MSSFNWFRRSYDESDKSSAPQENAPANDAAEKSAESTETAPVAPEDYLKWAKAAYQNIQQRQTATPAESAEAESAEAESAEAETDAATETTEPEQAAAPEDAPAEAETDPAETAATTESTATESATPAPETAPAPEAETETVPDADEPVVSEAPEVPEAPAAPAEPAEPEAAEPVASETLETPEAPETPGGPETSEAPEAPEASAEPAAPRPFWAQAEAERQARLEQLKAEAIAEPEPEPEPVAAESRVEDLPLLEFDDAFMWSAEVLASQGRRPDQISLEEITWLNRLRQGLDKTRRSLVNQLKSIVGQGPLNQDAVLEIEALLLQADVGVAATDAIIDALQARLREEVLPPEQAIAFLKSILRDMLDKPLGDSHNLAFVPDKDSFSIWLMTGVNGAGKTTTIGKLAHIATKSDYRCLIAAADTFRAAAVEQVKVWGQRSGVDVIANPGQNTDPASVVFDAIAAAKSRNVNLLLVDTAGRLQNKKNLMDELAKVRRIIDKKAPEAQVESLLVLDATLGQNGLRQAQIFAEAAQLSGVVLTKLDGTAKGGVALAVVQQLGLPIRFIGAGEGIEDLRPFSSFEFVEALLSG